MLTEGRRVTVTNTIDLSPHTTLNIGETGCIVRAGIEPFLDDFAVEVLMDRNHPGLNEWGNRALLVYPDIGSLSLHTRERLRLGVVVRRLAAVITAVSVWSYALVTRSLL